MYLPHEAQKQIKHEHAKQSSIYEKACK